MYETTIILGEKSTEVTEKFDHKFVSVDKFRHKKKTKEQEVIFFGKSVKV